MKKTELQFVCGFVIGMIIIAVIFAVVFWLGVAQ